MKIPERRRFKRLEVRDLTGTLALSLKAEVLNLSLAGLAVRTHTPLEPGKKFVVRIGTGPAATNMIARVRWSSADEEEGTDFRSGLMFEDVLTERAQRLLDFLEQNIEVALDRQLFGRLEVQGETSASLEADYDFSIRSLGQGGMLLCARFRPLVGSVFDLEANLDSNRFASPAKVVEVRGEEEDGSFLIAVEFVDMRPQDRSMLRSFLRSALGSAPRPAGDD